MLAINLGGLGEYLGTSEWSSTEMKTEDSGSCKESKKWKASVFSRWSTDLGQLNVWVYVSECTCQHVLEFIFKGAGQAKR